MPNHRRRNGGGGQETFEGENFANFWVCIGVRSNFILEGPNVIYSDMHCMYEYKVFVGKILGEAWPPSLYSRDTITASVVRSHITWKLTETQ